MKKKPGLAILASLSLILLTLFVGKATFANSVSGQVKKIQDTGVLKVGVEQGVPNFGYYSAETGKYEGMGVDLAKKIAEKLGVKVSFTAVTAQTREALLDNGQTDILIATYTITEERQASHAISDLYYYDEIGFLVNKSKGYDSIADLDGLTIDVAQGSTTKSVIEEYGEAHNLSFNFVQLSSYPELAISLYASRISAFSVDKSILTGYVSKKTEIIDGGFNTQEYSIAATESNQSMIDYINNLPTGWKADGSLQELYDKYDLTPATADDN